MSAAYLKSRKIANSRIVAELLAARLLGCRRLDIPLKANCVLPENSIAAMRRGVTRSGTGEPIQYIIAQWDFRGITLKTDKRALIPRPETEELVQLFLDNCKDNDSPRVLDFGTGTGCIAISVAKEKPKAKIMAVDISEDALNLARENASSLGVADRISFVNLSDVDLSDVLEPGTIDIIISNPPYIPTATYETLDRSVKDFEPREALDGGQDGMDVIRSIIEEAAMLLDSDGRIFLEISAENNQAPKITQFLSEVGFEDATVHKDALTKERFISARLASGL